jgi:hypothetical protein
MSCGQLTGNEDSGFSMLCQVNSVGQLNPRFYFNPTIGKYYYRLFLFDGSDCRGNNIAFSQVKEISQLTVIQTVMVIFIPTKVTG